jgi:hypothetical protein
MKLAWEAATRPVAWFGRSSSGGGEAAAAAAGRRRRGWREAARRRSRRLWGSGSWRRRWRRGSVAVEGGGTGRSGISSVERKVDSGVEMTIDGTWFNIRQMMIFGE